MTSFDDSLPASPPPDRDHAAPLWRAGSRLVSAWVASIVVHALLFSAMLILVFPFSPRSEIPEPAVRAELVGPVDAPLDQPSRPNPFAEAVATPEPARVTPAPRSFAEMDSAVRAPVQDLTVMGIGAATGNDDIAGAGLGLGGGRADFFGLGGAARGVRSIVYVVDRSASMIDIFDAVRHELKRSVNALDRSQQFHVIFFNEGPILESPPKRLVNAVSAYREQLFEFLNGIQPTGRTKPEAALRRALSFEPDVVYLLSDGEDFQDSLLKRLKQWNADGRSRIHTLAYEGSDDARAILQQIAREHNGEFRDVNED